MLAGEHCPVARRRVVGDSGVQREPPDGPGRIRPHRALCRLRVVLLELSLLYWKGSAYVEAFLYDEFEHDGHVFKGHCGCCYGLASVCTCYAPPPFYGCVHTRTSLAPSVALRWF